MLQICSKLDRRRGAVERPATGLRALPRRNPRSPKGHDENLPPALSRTRFIKEPCPRRAAPSRTVCHEAALLCLRISQSHPRGMSFVAPTTTRDTTKRKQEPHPLHGEGAGRGMTRQITSVAAPRRILEEPQRGGRHTNELDWTRISSTWGGFRHRDCNLKLSQTCSLDCN